MRIMLVEDDPLIAMAAETMLSAAGHDVIGPFYNAETALSNAQDSNADVAIVDINLAGGEEGVDVARRLLAEHGIYSVFATGQLSIAQANKDAALGVLAKPYTESSLLEAIPVLKSIVQGSAPPPPPIPVGMEVF